MLARFLPSLFLLSPLACGDKIADGDDLQQDTSSEAPETDSGDAARLDDDGDGYYAEADGGDDCDDGDGLVNPGAEEICDGIDNDCDGVTDPDSSLGAQTWYVDSDDDGYGDVDSGSFTSCDGAEGLVNLPGDCDDDDPAVNPGAEEICDDLDNNCDGQINEAPADTEGTWYYDADSDGYGDINAPIESCEQPEGYVENADDCDDTSADYTTTCPNPEVNSSATCSGKVYRYLDGPRLDPELHIFGTYEGSGGHGEPAETTTVTIERETEMVLVLSSYEPVHWEVSVADGATLTEVILNGYNSHTADVPDGVMVTDRSGTSHSYFTACGYQWPTGSGGCDTAALVNGAELYSGLELTSFTGCYHGTAYTLE
jgi:hypothetical protein